MLKPSPQIAGLPAFAAAFHEYPELTPIKKLFTKRNRYVNLNPPNIRFSNNEYLPNNEYLFNNEHLSAPCIPNT